MLEKVEFTMLSDGRVLDLRPMYENKPPLVFQDGVWVNFNGHINEVIQSKPINNSKASAQTVTNSLLQ